MKRFIEHRPTSDTARRPLPPLAGNLLFHGALFAMSLLVMAIENPLFLLWYHAQAAEASAAELALVVWNGLKLDQTVAGYITALPLLVVLAALWIPGRWSRSVLKGYLLVIAAVSATAFAANLALYEYWAFPLDSSVLQYLASPKEALASVTAGQLLLQLLVAAAVAGGLMSYFIGRRILAPMVKLSNASKEVARGNYTITIEDSSKMEEVQTTFRNFNAMVRELAATDTLQTDFISSVSHEFKTPIGAIEGYTQLLQDHQLTDAERDAYVDKILCNTARLSSLVGNILLLSKIANRSVTLTKSRYRLDEQIRQVIVAAENKWGE